MFIKCQMVVSPPEIFTKSGLGRPLSANFGEHFWWLLSAECEWWERCVHFNEPYFHQGQN